MFGVMSENDKYELILGSYSFRLFFSSYLRRGEESAE